MFNLFKKDYKIFTVKFDKDNTYKNYAWRQYSLPITDASIVLEEVRLRVLGEFPNAKNIMIKHIINL